MQRYTVYLYLEIALHVLRGTSTHYQERIRLYLQQLVFVTPLLLPAAIVEELELVEQFQLIHDSGRYLHPSSGAHTTVSIAAGICHTVIATTRNM